MDIKLEQIKAFGPSILKVQIPIWNDAIDQFRPYLSLSDAVRVIQFIVAKNIFNQQTYNILTGNYTVRQILQIIKKNNYEIKIKRVKSPILNQNSYKVSRHKFEKLRFKQLFLYYCKVLIE